MAFTGAAVLLVLIGRLLWSLPRPVWLTAGRELPRVQLVFSARPAPGALAPAAGPRPAATAAAPAPGITAPARIEHDQAGPPSASVPATAAPASPIRLYADDGHVRLPDAGSDPWSTPRAAPGSAAPPSASAEADRLLRRPNPVEARGTRFAKDWISDGDAADVAQQELARAQRKVAEFLLGRDIEYARARPSPEVRFNPARHERVADLGSDATGDAYKAAPIDYEPAPGLDGEASRRIREQVAALERRYARCDHARLARLMQPLLVHLDELQKTEAAYARGADPVRAEHLLPNTANSAYDMARRALWYADQRMAGCTG